MSPTCRASERPGWSRLRVVTGRELQRSASVIFLDANPARPRAVSRYWSTIFAAWGIAAGVASQLLISTGFVGGHGGTDRWLIRGVAVAIALFGVIPALRRVGRHTLAVTARLIAVGSLLAAFALSDLVLVAVLGGR